MNPKIKKYISSLEKAEISASRRVILQPLIDQIRTDGSGDRMVRLNFICTHNSRRSHLAQIWMQTLAVYYGLHGVRCYSGGTEVTTVFPMILKILADIGFAIHKNAQSSNPVYSIKFAENSPSFLTFSKRYDHFFNPDTDFTAVMTCDQADQECPFVPGAACRIAIPYEDPKWYDGTSIQEVKYQETSAQIAAELAYVVRSLLSR